MPSRSTKTHPSVNPRRVAVVTAAMLSEIPELAEYGLDVGDMVTDEGGIPTKASLLSLIGHNSVQIPHDGRYTEC